MAERIRSNYYPYGESKTSTAGDDREGFATYTRDEKSGLDYADQRWYANGVGRFSSPDPSMPFDVSIPQSWNFYAYVENDPANYSDPTGLILCGDVRLGSGFGIYAGRTVREVMMDQSGSSIYAQTIWHEGGTIYDDDLKKPAGYYADLTGIGTAILNQYLVDNERISVYLRGTRHSPLGRFGHRTLKEIIIAVAKDNAGALFDSGGRMRAEGRNKLEAILRTDILSGELVPDLDGGRYNRACEGVVSSLRVAGGLAAGSIPLSSPNGLTILFWNLAHPHSADDFPGSVGYVGVGKVRTSGHTFWGLSSRPTSTPGAERATGNQIGAGRH